MLQLISLLIEPLHIVCFYILFFTQSWAHVRNLRVKNIKKLAVTLLVMILFQFLVELYSPIRWLLVLCTNLATILFLVLITYLTLRQHNHSDLTLQINVLLSMDIFIAVQIFCAFLDKSLLVLCQDVRAVHPMILVVILHNVVEGVLAFSLGIISGRLYNLYRIIDKKINSNDDEGKALSEVRVPVVSKDDELAELTVLFNRMLDRMHRYVEQQQQFVGDVSHELRTPVAIIQGHLELLERWGKDDPQVLDESIKASLQEIDRMKNLVQEMLDLSRAEQVEIQYKNEIADAREVGLQVFNDFKMIHPDFQIVLDNDLKSKTPVRIYRNHLEQILIILLDNAVKYSTDRKEIHMAMSKNTRYVELVVQDFGEGISQANIKKIFDRFYRVDKARSRNKGGNGLGLSIAHRLVEGYHGSISVESVEGQGSVFKVQLPLVKDVQKE